jgi:glycosyltransferase involved in cell wall biosynthesis
MTQAAGLAVDIVIDNYDYGAFLAAAIESALAQTHEKVEVIVVDDGSGDDSREVLRGYEDRVDVVLKGNGGQASALNAGMARSRGDVVIFLDADDTLHPEAAARAAAAFAADERLSKVQCRMEIVDAAGRPTGAIKPAPHLPMPSGDLRAAELAFPFDLAWLATSGNAFRAEAVRRVLPIPEDEYRICADWYLVHVTTLLGQVASLEQVGASYRLHGANSYEQETPSLDLDRLRTNVRLAQSTSRALLKLADELGLERPERILSLADLANRLISLKLEPELHPLPGDGPGELVLDAVRAARRRSDVSAPMKAMFVLWFGAMAIAPRSLARRLAALFLFPESRSSLNRVLGRLQGR